MGLESNIALVVASLDLKLVQLLRDAIRTTDLAGARASGGGNLAPTPEILPRRHFVPEPLIENRRHIHPQTLYEARPVIHPQPRVVEPPPPICPPAEPISHLTKSPFVPPWKVMPWENPPQPALKIKVIKLRPDIVRKGSLIDCFL
ncbi:MAG: hypothetical protein JWN40_3154 [Phycisphaerales bacterium]|nr:hypothetical protein [Phycisphaerales bacterium]